MYRGITKLQLVCTGNAAQGVVLWYGVSGCNSNPSQNGGVSLGSSAGRLYCSSPAAFGAAMADVGWEGAQCWASKGPPGWSTSQWHLDRFVTPYARSSQLIDQPVATFEGVKLLKQNKNKKKPSMLGCFSLEGLLREQQKEGERGKLFTLHFGVRRQ